MKYLTSLLMAVVALSVSAADSAIDSAAQIFNAKELQIESAYVLRTDDLKKYDDSTSFGVNYFITEGAGIHAAVGLRDLNGQAIDLVEFGPTARLTFENSNLALLFGIGAEKRFNIDSHVRGGDKPDPWAVYAELGPVFRVSKHLDLFAKIRGVKPLDTSRPNSGKGEHVAIILGADIPFGL